MVLRSRSVIVSWQAPCAGWIKEIFDGFLLNGAGGDGVLFRECGGRPLMMTGRMFKAGRIFNVGSMVDTELKAAGLQGPQLTTHSKMVVSPRRRFATSRVHLIKERDDIHNGQPVLVNIWRVASEFLAFEVRHTLQEDNVGADLVANFQQDEALD